MCAVTEDGWGQRGGIDRVITLTSGHTINVEEKVREHGWPDVLLERWSDEERKLPGWIQKNLATDYLAYIFVPQRSGLWIPFLDLRRAWKLNGRRWGESYPIVHAQNNGYVTVSVAIPIDELQRVLSENMRITWISGDDFKIADNCKAG